MSPILDTKSLRGLAIDPSRGEQWLRRAFWAGDQMEKLPEYKLHLNLWDG